MVSLATFAKLVQVEADRFYEISRLPRSLLKDHDLTDYIQAAENGQQNARPYLDFLLLQQQPTSQHPNIYVCVLASAGTGKTQLAATASLTYNEATTIYLNMGRGESQRFYAPHINFGSKMLKREIAAFLENRHDSAGEVAANEIAAFAAGRDDDGTFLFVRFLYHLLTGEPFIGEEPEKCSSRMTLAKVKASIQGKKYLVFLDEVPPIGDREFRTVLCLRDTLRYLGIAPILMSTHTGAQDYVGSTSRKSADVWTWVLSSLPKYTPFPPKISQPGLVDTERPLVLALTQQLRVPSLPQTVREIQKLLQKRKPEAWLASSALQLAQLFCTDIELDGECFAAAHNLVGHHFGCLLQDDEDGRQSYNCLGAENFQKNLSVAPVCASSEPLLYLALITWDVGMLGEGREAFFPLVDHKERALTVREAFNRSKGDFISKASTANPKAEKCDGDLLEVLVHASLTLASMRTGVDNDKFLVGMNLKEFIPLVRSLMLPGYLGVLPDTPNLFDNLKFSWPVVPALGGSNLGLPSNIAEATGSDLGYLERPEDKEMNDGTITYVCRDGNTSSEKGDDKPFICVECKNYRDGASSSVLKEVFKRIKGGIQCSLIFVSSLQRQCFRRTKLENVKQDCFSHHHKPDSVTVLVWGSDKNPTYLEVGGEPFVAENMETDLLVVIIEVEIVDACIRRRRKRKYAPCENR